MAKEVKRSSRKATTTTDAGTPEAAPKPARARSKAKPVVTDDQIRARAYEIFLSRNGAPGDPAADWAQAERELRGE